VEKENTMQALMGEIKLVDKRLNDFNGSFDKAVILDTDRPSFAVGTDGKHDNGLAKTFMQGKFQSYKDLVIRLAKLKKLRDQQNMETNITVAGKTMSIYDALIFKRTSAKALTRLYSMVKQSITEAEARAENRNYHQEKGGKLSVVPLLNVNDVHKEAEQHEAIIQGIDDAITVANSTTQVTY